MDLPDSYFAGLFDGEGTVIITKPSASDPRKHQLRVAICMTHKPTIDLLVARFGGHQKIVDAHKYNSNARLRHDWVATGSTAAEFLERVKPWLVTKAAACEIGLMFYQTTGTRGVKLTSETLEAREQLRLALSKVNQRGQH